MHSGLFQPEDWYWHVLETDEIYASGRRQTVETSDEAYQAFIAQNTAATRIVRWDELKAVLSTLAPQSLPVDLAAYAAQARWALEVGGITVDAMPVDTSRDSQALVHGAVTMAQTDPDFSFKFKTAAGFVDLDAATILAVGAAVAGHVQACFAWEAEMLTQIASGTINSEADIDARAVAFSNT